MPFGLWARMGRRNHTLDGGPAVLRDVAMATNFGTKIAISWLCVNDCDYAIGYEGGLSGRRQNADIAKCRYPAPKGRSMATTFWLSVDYNFSCMIASNTLFDSRSGFSGSNYPIKT